MTEVIFNQFPNNIIPKQEEKRLLLQKERSQEMKRFLATQASNNHPRLAKLLKKNKEISTSITEYKNNFELLSQREQVPYVDQEYFGKSSFNGNGNGSGNSKTNGNESRYTSPLQPLPPAAEIQPPPQSHNHIQWNQPQANQITRENIYGYPPFQTHAMAGYPTMSYHPNPYTSPLQHSPYATNPNSEPSRFGNNSFPDQYSPHYQPRMQQDNYNQADPRRGRELGFQNAVQLPPHPPTNLNPYMQNTYHPRMRSQHSYDDLHRGGFSPHPNQQDQYSRHHPRQKESKRDYAADLDRQIKEKNEQRLKDKQWRATPEGGFLGVGTQVKQQKYQQEMEPEDFNSRKQSRYLRELDEQIRTKKELEQREHIARQSSSGDEVHQHSYETFYDSGKGSRKKFPDMAAKTLTSSVFPASPLRSPQILNKYSTLPTITSHGYPSPPTGFPPTGHAAPPSFLRGSMHVDAMTDWQREEMRTNDDKKRRNQKEIQDVLKQQIAQKEFEKQRKKQEQRIEDEKEMIKIEKEQMMLKERFQREREELKKKEEQERLEKEKAISEKKARRIQEQEYNPIPLHAKKVIRALSPEHQETINPVPFRSNSPPLPAVLKKMKEQGYTGPREQEGPQDHNMPIPATSPDQSPPRHTTSFSRSSNRNTQPSPLLQPPTQSKTRALSQQSASPVVGHRNDNFELISQLEAIQRELQNEDQKVQREIRNEPFIAAKQEKLERADRERFQKDLDGIDQTITAEQDYYNEYYPTEPRAVKSAHFKRHKDVYTPRSKAQTPAPGSYSVENRSRKIPTRQLDAESQIMDISKNLQVMNFNISDFSTSELPSHLETSSEDIFNIDEIERRNARRLRKFENTQGQEKRNRTDRDVLANFMALSDDNSNAQTSNSHIITNINAHSSDYDYEQETGRGGSIPTSPSTFQPLSY